MSDESMSILRDGDQDWLPIPLPGAEGVFVKALKAYERASLEEAAAIDPMTLVEIIPPAA